MARSVEDDGAGALPLGQGHYLCGIEPATNPVGGRDRERQENRLLMLDPGATRRYHLEIGVLASAADINAFAQAHI